MIYVHEKKLVVSENVIQEIWNQILFYIDKNKLDHIWNINLETTKIELLKKLFKQSQEFNASKSNLSIDTLPLIQYYTYTNLIIILILIKGSKELRFLKKTHGMKFTITDESTVDLNNLKVKITDGIFFEYLSLVKQTPNSYLKLQISFKDLLSFNINLYDYFHNENCSLPAREIYSFEFGGKNYFQVNLLENHSFEDYQRQFNKIDFSIFTNSSPRIMVPYSDGYPIYVEEENIKNSQLVSLDRNVYGEPFLVASYNSNGFHSFSQLEILYMISYGLSNLVRYHPAYWIEICKNTELFWLIKKNIEIIDRCLPNYFLNTLSKQDYIFTQPGILTRYINF